MRPDGVDALSTASWARMVFRTRGYILREFATFASFDLFNYAANWAAPLLVEVGGISPIVAQLGFTIALVIGSWFWHNHSTFRDRGAP